jgi:hypothetical protein
MNRKHQAIRQGAFMKMIVSFAAMVLSTNLGSRCLAQPSQSDVLKSIGEGIDNQGGDPTRVLALFIAALGLTLLLLVLSHRRKRVVAPKALNHPGKLLREISRAINLRPAEIRQLKLLAEQQSLASPLTLLLCPSLLARGIKDCEGKVDRETLSGIARRLATRE